MKYIISVTTIVFMSLLTSCSDFLEVENQSSVTTDTFWQTEKHVQQGLIAAYASLQTQWGDKFDFFEQNYIGLNYRGDDVDNNKAELYGAKLASFTNTTEESTTYNLWLTCYAGIARANQVIGKTPTVGELSEEKKAQYIGEAKFLRAFNYFLLVNTFVEIPLITQYATGQSELRPGQSTASEVWQLIESDLKDAEQTIVEEQPAEWKGRVTKWSAKSLLGKVYLFQEKWMDAEAKFKEVVEQGPYDLLDNYADNFNGKAENGVESVFEIQFSANREGGVDERQPFNWEVTPYVLDGWELFYPSEWLMDEMMLDKTAANGYSERVYESVFFDDPASVISYPTNSADDVNYADVKDDLNNPYYFKKYNKFSDRQGSYIGTNISLIRFADVLLMYAEALNENGKIGLAVDQVNRVRSRADAVSLDGASFTKESLRTQIRHHERPVELSMEFGIRWFDLIRWTRGMTGTESVKATLQLHGKPFAENFVVGKHEMNPIPFQEISLNTNLNQHTTW